MDEHERADFEYHDYLRSMKFRVGHNRSDTTMGWDGIQDSFRVFYIHHPLEYSYTKSYDSSHTLIHGQTPSVTFQVRTKFYLNEPYTKCNPDPAYTKRTGFWNLYAILYKRLVLRPPKNGDPVRPISKHKKIDTRTDPYSIYGSCTSLLRRQF